MLPRYLANIVTSFLFSIKDYFECFDYLFSYDRFTFLLNKVSILNLEQSAASLLFFEPDMV